MLLIIKYLGVTIDRRLNFKQHVIYTTEKAAGVQDSLARLMPDIEGQKFATRSTYLGKAIRLPSLG